jgi:hypothetical protein
MRRPRGPGGRFLTAEEIAAQQKAAETSDPSSFQPNPNPSAEERKALKASESVPGSTARRPEPSFGDMLAGNGEANTGPGPEFRSFTDAQRSSAPDNGHDTSGSYSTSAPSQPSSVTHVQYSDLNAGPPLSGPGLR